jgi:hypothetical protein
MGLGALLMLFKANPDSDLNLGKSKMVDKMLDYEF